MCVSLLFAVGALGCQSTKSADQQKNDESSSDSDEEQEASQAQDHDDQPESAPDPDMIEALDDEPDDSDLEAATFAGGCFWCMEPPFDEVDGVADTIVGYTGGEEEHPTYRQVASAGTGHAEAIRIHYDPDRVSYEELLEIFWRNINPTQSDGQFIDRGPQYRSAIFAHDDEQKRLAERSLETLEEADLFDKPIATEIESLDTFWKAEEYHQDFYKKDPERYKSYRRGSGRDGFLEKTWKDRQVFD
ncbi:MAG: peptide-methionine (S)-S-oxide reductase MsrA [Persicimonas sp.]